MFQVCLWICLFKYFCCRTYSQITGPKFWLKKLQNGFVYYSNKCFRIKRCDIGGSALECIFDHWFIAAGDVAWQREFDWYTCKLKNFKIKDFNERDSQCNHACLKMHEIFYLWFLIQIQKIFWDQQFERLDYPGIPIQRCEYLKLACTMWWKEIDRCRIQLEYSFSFDFQHHRSKRGKHCCIDNWSSHFFSE